MKRYIETVSEIFKEYGDRSAFVQKNDTLSYNKLDEESGRVYAYLKEKGIGKECFVLILFPRNIHFASCVLGVWKAGAAFVLVEEGYPKDRVEHIKKDVGSMLTLDFDLFNKIINNYEPLSGYEQTGLHNAAYAVYTSGSTGNPKGVLHEYGNIDQCASTAVVQNPRPEMSTGFVSPLNFVASIMSIINNTLKAVTMHMISQSLLRDYKKLAAYIVDQKLDTIYLPPSYIRIYKDPAPSLKAIPTGSEPANGIFYEGGKPLILNTYGMSEAGFPVLMIILDRAYDVAPVGKPVLEEIDVHLIDEDGNRIEGEGQGELCFKNEYVRGYINLPKQTALAFKDGIYHTGDICRRDKDGLYYAVGRTDDMIKINGNRIEPAEIEAAVKKCTGLSNVVAKGFSEGGRSYIAVYFLRDEADTLGILYEKGISFDEDRLKQMLPTYMLPTYYVPILEFPINANGKLSKKDLKAPVTQNPEKIYLAPRNDIEKYFCDIMTEVLGKDKIGILDDFFEMGGDSIKAIILVNACEKYHISSKEIYEYRTPEGLAEKCASGDIDDITDEYNEEALKESFLLNVCQRQIIYYHKFVPGSNFLDMYVFLKLKDEIDLSRLALVVDRVFTAHPALFTRINKNEDGSYTQKYDKTLFKPTVIEEMSDLEFEENKDKINSHITIENSPLYKCRIIKTDSEAYLWISLDHVVIDGAGMGLLMDDIADSYYNDDYNIKHDYFFSVLKKLYESKKAPKYFEARDYYEKIRIDLEKTTESCILNKDFEVNTRKSDVFYMTNAYDRSPVRNSNFFLAACAIALAWYNGSDKAVVSTLYVARDDKYKMSAIGSIATCLIISVDLSEESNPKNILKSVNEQISYGIAYSEYCVLEDLPEEASDIVRFNYEKDIIKPSKIQSLAKEKVKYTSEKYMPGTMSVNMIDNTGDDKLGLVIRYSKDNYNRESIARYIELFQKAVAFLEES